MSNTFRIAALVACFLTVGAGLARAQSVAGSAPPTATQSAGPRMDADAIALRPAAATSSPADDARMNISAARNGFSQGEVLMIVGGAALVAGAVIGGNAGTIIMIGGAGVGIYGLYEFLNDK